MTAAREPGNGERCIWTAVVAILERLTGEQMEETAAQIQQLLASDVFSADDEISVAPSTRAAPDRRLLAADYNNTLFHITVIISGPDTARLQQLSETALENVQQNLASAGYTPTVVSSAIRYDPTKTPPPPLEVKAEKRTGTPLLIGIAAIAAVAIYFVFNRKEPDTVPLSHVSVEEHILLNRRMDMRAQRD